MEEKKELTFEQKTNIRDLVDAAFEMGELDTRKYESEIEILEEKYIDENKYKEELKRNVLLANISSSEKAKSIKFCAKNDYFKSYGEDRYIESFVKATNMANSYNIPTLKFNYVRLSSMNKIYSRILILIATNKEYIKKIDKIDSDSMSDEMYEYIDKIGEEKYWGNFRWKCDNELLNEADRLNEGPPQEIINEEITENTVEVNENIYDKKEMEDKFRNMFEKFMKEYKNQ